MIELDREFKDGGGRKWEIFTDMSYYDMICVRMKNDRKFNSPTSFHFGKREDVEAFVELLKKAI